MVNVLTIAMDTLFCNKSPYIWKRGGNEHVRGPVQNNEKDNAIKWDSVLKELKKRWKSAFMDAVDLAPSDYPYLSWIWKKVILYHF